MLHCSVSHCREVGRRAGVPVQEFAVRNDMPCGSTIGPILAHNLGCRTVDVGMPQLSMHSIREMAGVDDVLYGYKHFREFFRWAWPETNGTRRAQLRRQAASMAFS